MKRLLLIKLTSLGDLIHALPALSDAYMADPSIVFDWMIDENFQEVASWHPAVKNVLTTNHRSWRGGLTQASTFHSVGTLISQLRASAYDLVIDGQGNFKTALLSLCALGPSSGFDRHSVREWIAHLAYNKKYAVSKEMHAIERLRRLFAFAIGYPMPSSSPQFLIQRDKFLKPSCDLPKEYLVFVHNASWETKLWPESHWAALIKQAVADGFCILLPWGNERELARAKRLAVFPQIQVLPRLNLSEIGYVLERAKAAVCMDTGLSHLIGALDIPSVTLYGSTDSGLIGSSGESQIHLHSNLPCSPCQKKTCRLSQTEIPCMAHISPERVYKDLLRQASLRCV